MNGFDPLNPDVEMDRLLTAAMQSRAEARWGGGADLAAAAMERAKMSELGAARMRRVSRWVRFSSVAAAVLLVSVVVTGVWWEAQMKSGMAISETVTQSSSSSSSVYGTELTGVVVLLVVMGGILLKGVLSNERGPADMGGLVRWG